MLFEEWLSANEKWNNSKLVISIRSNVAFRKRGSRKWFTRMELVAKYQDPEIAEEVIREKESLNKAAPGSCARPHPDAPANEKMRQYLCFDEATEANEEDTILSSMFQCVEREKAKRKSKDKKRKRSSSSSGASSSSRSSSGSESSDSSDKKKKKKKSKKAKKEKCKKGKKGKKEKKEKTREQKEREAKKLADKEQKEKNREEEKKCQEKRGEAKKARGLYAPVVNRVLIDCY